MEWLRTVKNTWLFLKRYNMEINEEPQFMLLRDGDAYLMDILYDSEVPPRFFLAINRCRLSHEVLTLSDLITGQGNKIRNYLWTEHPIPHDDRRKWPIQGIPTKSDWKIWRECLKAIFVIRANDATIHSNY